MWIVKLGGDFALAATATATALQAQLAEVNIEARRFEASVMLVKALGGGWEAQPQ